MASEQPKPPYATYAALAGVFGAGVAGVGAAAALRGRRPEELTVPDLAVLSVATFKASRTVAGVVGLHTIAPRSGRVLTWTLGAAAANDFLQAGFSALTAKVNELEQRAGR